MEPDKKLFSRWKMRGEETRAIVRVQGQGGNTGHVFIAENINGKVRFIDPQTGDTGFEKYFNCVKRNKTYAIRIDHLKFADNVKKCCKERGPYD